MALTFRAVEEGDADELVGLYREVFGARDQEMGAEWFRWKYVANPFGGPYGFVAEEDSGAGIVGARLLWRWDLEVQGDVVPAYQLTDAAVQSAYRRRGVFTELMELCRESYFAEDCVFSFSPLIWSSGLYKRFGFRLEGLAPWLVRLNTLGGVLGGRTGEKTIVLPAQDALQLLEDSRSRYGREKGLQVVQPVRTAEVFRWRFVEQPNFRYRVALWPSAEPEVAVLYRKARPYGLPVVRVGFVGWLLGGSAGPSAASRALSRCVEGILREERALGAAHFTNVWDTREAWMNAPRSGSLGGRGKTLIGSVPGRHRERIGQVGITPWWSDTF